MTSDSNYERRSGRYDSSEVRAEAERQRKDREAQDRRVLRKDASAPDDTPVRYGIHVGDYW